MFLVAVINETTVSLLGRAFFTASPSFRHRPALIQSTEAMKCLLDSMLVLTKQDRLCHVIHATSDPFYQTWLRQLNVMQHCKVRGTSLSLNVESKLINLSPDYHCRGLL